MAFTLVLLTIEGIDRGALRDAVQRVAKVSADEAHRILDYESPVPVKTGLTHPDALIAQFELICCDAVSVFIADEVVAEAPAEYLTGLYARLRQSDEFGLMTVRLDSVPDDSNGQAFCDRFLGGQRPGPSLVAKLMRKKVRIMQHWATRIGGRMTILSQQAEPD